MMDQPKTSAQGLRIKRWFIALIAYVIVFAAVTIAGFLGLGAMPLFAYLVFVLLAILGNVVFGFLLLSGRNQAFKDPSLTMSQMLYSYLWGVIPLYYLPDARLVVIIFYLPSFSFGMLRLDLRGYVKAASTIIGLYWAVLVIEYLQQRPGFDLYVELFQFILFALILLWFVFFGSLVSNIRYRLRQQNKKLKRAQEELKKEVDQRKIAQTEAERVVKEFQDALAKVKTLKGLVPICATCKKIRDDRGFWKQLEAYLKDHSDAEFSHGICPECAKKFFDPDS